MTRPQRIAPSPVASASLALSGRPGQQPGGTRQRNMNTAVASTVDRRRRVVEGRGREARREGRGDAGEAARGTRRGSKRHTATLRIPPSLTRGPPCGWGVGRARFMTVVRLLVPTSPPRGRGRLGGPGPSTLDSTLEIIPCLSVIITSDCKGRGIGHARALPSRRASRGRRHDRPDAQDA